MSTSKERRYIAFAQFCEEVKGFKWFSVMDGPGGNLYFCFTMPDGQQRFCRNMPPEFQKELGIYGNGEFVYWRDVEPYEGE